MCDEAVKRLKQLITSYPVLRQYDPGRKLYLTTECELIYNRRDVVSALSGQTMCDSLC